MLKKTGFVPELWAKKTGSAGVLVPEKGVEPSRPCGQRILSPPRLPFRHSGPFFKNSMKMKFHPQAGAIPTFALLDAAGAKRYPTFPRSRGDRRVRLEQIVRRWRLP